MSRANQEPEVPHRAGGSAKVGEGYWTGLWSAGDLPPPADPHSVALGDEVNRAFFRYFAGAFAGLDTPRCRLIELGAAQSQWLPTLQREFGFAVTGLDYSAAGCDRARAMLARAAVDGEIVCADLFAPPAGLLGAFDVVLSIGVVEHFEDTAACLRAASAYVRPGGRVVTIIPNMWGLPGLLQRALDRAIYDIHVPLDSARLASAHRSAALTIRDCGPLMAVNWNVLSSGRWQGTRLDRPLRRALSAASKLAWLGERAGVALPPNRFTSPYFACTAEKPTRR